MMRTREQRTSPPRQSSNRNGMESAIATHTEEFRLTKRTSFKLESGGSRSASEEFRVSKRPSSKKESDRPGSFFLSKGSSDPKWQRANMVVGALEVQSDPYLQPKEDMKPLYKDDGGATASKFEDALQAWVDLKLRKSFTRACADLPDFVCCCGLSQSDHGSTIKQYVVLLNDGWVKHANKKIRSRGFKIDTFVSDYNTLGKESSSIMLIRFFELSTYKFRQASEEGSLDLNDMLLDKNGPLDASSHYSASHNTSEELQKH